MPLSGFNKRELFTYLEFLLNQFRRADGFWFLEAEDKFGYDAAIKINEDVWDRMGRLMTREIKQRFGIEQRGLEAFVKVMQVYPWFLISRHQIEVNPGEVYIGAPHCPSQEARLKRNIGEYDCKDMHRREFESIIKEVDERIRVECVFAPPDPHPPELFCKWRFTMMN